MGGTATLYLVASAAQPDAMKDPVVLRGLEDLQRFLESKGLVGNTLSVADYDKRVNRVLHNDDSRFDAICSRRESSGFSSTFPVLPRCGT